MDAGEVAATNVPREEDVDIATPSLPENATFRSQCSEETRFCPALLHLVRVGERRKEDHDPRVARRDAAHISEQRPELVHLAQLSPRCEAEIEIAAAWTRCHGEREQVIGGHHVGAGEMLNLASRNIWHQLADERINRRERPAAEQHAMRCLEHLCKWPRRVEKHEFQVRPRVRFVAGEEEHARVVILRAERGKECHNCTKRGGARRRFRFRFRIRRPPSCATSGCRCRCRRRRRRGRRFAQRNDADFTRTLRLRFVDKAPQLFVQLRIVDEELEFDDV